MNYTKKRKYEEIDECVKAYLIESPITEINTELDDEFIDNLYLHTKSLNKTNLKIFDQCIEMLNTFSQKRSMDSDQQNIKMGKLLKYVEEWLYFNKKQINNIVNTIDDNIKKLSVIKESLCDHKWNKYCEYHNDYYHRCNKCGLER